MTQNTSSELNSKLVEYFNECLSVENAAIETPNKDTGVPAERGKTAIAVTSGGDPGAPKQAPGHNNKIWRKPDRRQSSPVNPKTSGH